MPSTSADTVLNLLTYLSLRPVVAFFNTFHLVDFTLVTVPAAEVKQVQPVATEEGGTALDTAVNSDFYISDAAAEVSLLPRLLALLPPSSVDPRSSPYVAQRCSLLDSLFHCFSLANLLPVDKLLGFFILESQVRFSPSFLAQSVAQPFCLQPARFLFLLSHRTQLVVYVSFSPGALVVSVRLLRARLPIRANATNHLRVAISISNIHVDSIIFISVKHVFLGILTTAILMPFWFSTFKLRSGRLCLSFFELRHEVGVRLDNIQVSKWHRYCVPLLFQLHAPATVALVVSLNYATLAVQLGIRRVLNSHNRTPVYWHDTSFGG